ncbi:MAG: type IV pilin protein [Gammaproteobacteria bacterium]
MRRRRGFTLIEILIVVAVVGILAAIAYPAYQDSVRKSRRGQAKADLTELAQLLERNFTEANRYDQNSASVALAIGTAPLFNQSPRTGTANYTLTLPTLTASTFALNAAPAGAQAGDPCGTYTLNQVGAKGVTGGTLTAADCW